MDVTRISALSRTLHPRYRSTRHALVIGSVAAVAGATIAWLGGTEGWPVVAEGAVWGAASLLAWATARELDHDDPRGAFVAALLTPAALAWAGDGRPLLLVGGVLLLAGRTALRSTGLPLRPADLALTFIGGVVVAGSPAGWAAALVLAVAVAREATRPVGRVPAARWVAFALAVGATARLGFTGGFSLPSLDGAVWVPLVVGSVAVVAALGSDRRAPTVACDRTAETPSAADQWVARILVGVGAAAVTILALDPVAATTAVAALVGVVGIDRLRPGPTP